MTSVEREVAELRKQMNSDFAKYRHICSTVTEEKDRLAKAEALCLAAQEAQQHIQKLAVTVQQDSHRQISKIISRCLAAVFDKPYKLKIEFVRLRGKTEAQLSYVRDGHEEDPLRTSGGVLDVSALASRITKMILSEPQSRKFLVLDEPMKGVSAANLPKAALLLETLAKEMGIQFLIITHNEELEVGKVYRL